MNSYANAILAGFYNSKIVQNEFKNNHHKALWGVSGGQIDIVDVTNHLYVGCNNIHDSSIPGYPNAVGIEFAPTHIHNVELVGNSIYNHDGYAVSINYGNSDFGNIYIHNNSASNNGISPVTHTQYDYNDFTPTLVNNCSNTSCLVSCDYTIDSIFYDDFE